MSLMMCCVIPAVCLLIIRAVSAQMTVLSEAVKAEYSLPVRGQLAESDSVHSMVLTTDEPLYEFMRRVQEFTRGYGTLRRPGRSRTQGTTDTDNSGGKSEVTVIYQPTRNGIEPSDVSTEIDTSDESNRGPV